MKACVRACTNNGTREIEIGKKILQIMVVGENYEPMKFQLCNPNCKMSLELLYFLHMVNASFA